VVATTRASFYVYNTEADVDRLVAALWVAERIFHSLRSFTSPWPVAAGGVLAPVMKAGAHA
jgi:hypothetical protein